MLTSILQELNGTSADIEASGIISQIQVVHHSLMIGPNIHEYRQPLLEALLTMHDNEKGKGVLQEALGCQKWDAVDAEEMEFMIDLMDTLIT